jgi:hypothetical protein
VIVCGGTIITVEMKINRNTWVDILLEHVVLITIQALSLRMFEITGSVFFGDHTQTERSLFAGSVYVISILNLTFLTFLVASKNHPLVAKRGFWSALISALGSTLKSVLLVYIPAHNLKCRNHLFYTWIGLAIMLCFHYERCIVFYCHFVLSKQYEELAIVNLGIFESKPTSQSYKERIHLWIWDHRKYFHHGLLSFTKLVAFFSTFALCLFILMVTWPFI